MGDQFDELTRAMARPHSRRGVLKMVGTAAIGATAATVLKPFRAHATMCPPGGAVCGSNCCQAGEACSDPASGCCCPAGTTPCGQTCCTKGVACSRGVCGCPSGMTSCGTGTNQTCCAKGKPCGDASCQPISSFSANVAKSCNPCSTGTVLFSDDFTSDTPNNCVTSLANWNVQSGGNVDVVALWPGASANVIDLDGSSDQCPWYPNGTPLVSLKNPIPIVQGRTYTACFRIGTNPSPFLPLNAGLRPANDPDINSVDVVFGPASGTFTKNPSDPFTTESLTFVATASGTAPLTFQEEGVWDRGGILLDSVTISEKS